MEKRNIKVIIADDHSIFRSGLRILRSQLKNIEVVGEAVNGQNLIRQSVELSPDIILTDISIPIMDGIAATKELTRRKLDSRVIVLSAHGREEPILRMLEAGALGYVLKSADSIEISEAIATVYQHKPYFCREVTERLTEIVSKKYKLPARADPFFLQTGKKRLWS